MLWLIYGIIFTVNAVSLAAFGASKVVVVLAATTGLGAIATFFIAARPARKSVR